jgi:hypothetical protein
MWRKSAFCGEKVKNAGEKKKFMSVPLQPGRGPSWRRPVDTYSDCPRRAEIDCPSLTRPGWQTQYGRPGTVTVTV